MAEIYSYLKNPKAHLKTPDLVTFCFSIHLNIEQPN